MEFQIEALQDQVRAADAEELAAARDALQELSRPRLTGSDTAGEVAETLRGRLESLGYEIRELSFSFSTLPGRYGVPVAAGVFLIGAGLASAFLYTGRGVAALTALGATALALGGLGLALPAATDRLPWGRVTTSNWLARRPDSRPRYLVMAHRDSKSQGVPTLLRTAGIGCAAVAWTVLVVLAVIASIDSAWRWPPVVLGAAALAVLAAGLLLTCRAENDSPGALDNATGLAALLGIARREREHDHDDVGLLVTDAEELGLVGARAIRSMLPPVFGVVNLDGLDDSGDLRVVERHGWPRRGLAPHLTSALLGAAGALGVPARRQPLPPGILVDHIPLADAGIPAVTVMRGSLDSLRRVHRPQDRPDRLDGSGVADAVSTVSGALRILRNNGNGC